MLMISKKKSDYDPYVDPAYLLEVLNEMGEIIFSFDLENKKVFTNQAALKTFQIGPEVFSLNSPEWLSHVHPADVEKVKAGNRKVITGAEIRDEFRVIMPNKSFGWVSRHVKPIMGKNGKLKRLHVIIVNIDWYKSNTIALEGKIDDLSQVIYRIAHDLRGPLMSMLGIVNLSKYELQDSTAEKYMHLISESAKKMDNVILSLSSVVNIMSEVEKYKPVNLKEVISEILKSVEHLPQMKGLKVKTQYKHEKEFVCDPGLLRGILYNVIINAIKYRRRTDDAFVSISTRSVKNRMEIKIEDNGSGIKPESLDHIYKMFYKDNDLPGSSGLGLYIVKRSVEKMKGEISVESKLDVGTCFTVTLPEAKIKKSNNE